MIWSFIVHIDNENNLDEQLKLLNEKINVIENKTFYDIKITCNLIFNEFIKTRKILKLIKKIHNQKLKNKDDLENFIFTKVSSFNFLLPKISIKKTTFTNEIMFYLKHFQVHKYVERVDEFVREILNFDDSNKIMTNIEDSIFVEFKKQIFETFKEFKIFDLPCPWLYFPDFFI